MILLPMDLLAIDTNASGAFHLEPAMNKDKKQFRAAIYLLREANLDPGQTEALAMVERYPGDLRRHIAVLTVELDHAQHLQTAEKENLVKLQKAQQATLRLEEKNRAIEGRVALLLNRIGALGEGTPQPIETSAEPYEAVVPIAKHCDRVFRGTLENCPQDKVFAALIHYATVWICREWPGMAGRTASSLGFQSIPPGDDFEFAADRFFDRDYGVHLEHECREHRTELVNSYQIVALHQHISAPLADSDYKEVDFEIARRLPLAENF